jgi:glucose-1-phosphate cytidylyltransferase
MFIRFKVDFLKTIILAGGLGTRFSEETEHRPKPMILIDHRPIIWHIMDIYASQGYSDFVIATGYKSEVIEEWIETLTDKWNIVAVNTGLNTQTGGRIKKCIESLNDENFFVTYGDGLGNINLKELEKFHLTRSATVTATAVRPPARFGYMDIDDGLVVRFGEKNQLDEGWINGGFFMVNRSIVDYIFDDKEPFETGALPRLTSEGKFHAFQHEGFWFPMDTRSEQQTLKRFSENFPPPWKEF